MKENNQTNKKEVFNGQGFISIFRLNLGGGGGGRPGRGGFWTIFGQGFPKPIISENGGGRGGGDNWTAPVKSGSYKTDMGTSKDCYSYGKGAVPYHKFQWKNST